MKTKRGLILFAMFLLFFGLAPAPDAFGAYVSGEVLTRNGWGEASPPSSIYRDLGTTGWFAMVMKLPATHAPQGLKPGALLPVTARTEEQVTVAPAGVPVSIPRPDVRLLHISPSDHTAVPLIKGEVVLGFADGTTSQYQENLTQSISIFSPLAFFIHDTNGDFQGTLDQKTIATAHAHHIVVWPIVEAGFAPARTTYILTHPAAEWDLLTQIVSRAQTEHLDGINLDFEDMVESDAPRLDLFTAAVAQVLHAMGKGVAIDVTPPSSDPNWGAVYDRKNLSAIVDYEVVMTYDEHYDGDPVAGSVSSLPWMEQGIQNTLRLGVPKSKILLGVPFYTRDWSVLRGQVESSCISLAEAASHLAAPGAKIEWDAQDQQDVLTYKMDGTTHTIWLENAASLSRRGAFSKSAGLAGVGIWQMDMGLSNSLPSLISGL